MAGTAIAVESTAAAVKSFKFIRCLRCSDVGPTDSNGQRSDIRRVSIQTVVRFRFHMVPTLKPV